MVGASAKTVAFCTGGERTSWFSASHCARESLVEASSCSRTLWESGVRYGATVVGIAALQQCFAVCDLCLADACTREESITDITSFISFSWDWRILQKHPGGTVSFVEGRNGSRSGGL